MRKLVLLNELIESGSFREFWAEFESEDLYADLVVDCMGFEESMRDAIALQTSMIAREMKRELVQGWLNVSAEELPAYCQRYGWAIDGDQVTVPLNKENEAKTTVFRESVLFSRKSLPLALLWGVVLCSYAAVQSSTTSLGGASSRLPSDLPYAGRGIVFLVFYFLRYAFVYIDGLRERFRNGLGLPVIAMTPHAIPRM